MMADIEALLATERSNSHDRFHDTTKTLIEKYEMAGAAVESVAIPTGGADGKGRWVIHEAADIRMATADVITPVAYRLIDYRQNPWHVAQWSASTPPGGVRVDLIVLDGEQDRQSLRRLELSGKLVLIRQPLREVWAELAAMGAAGVISDHPVPGQPDAVAWQKLGWGGIPVGASAGPIVGLVVSETQGDRLRQLWRQSGAVTLHVEVDIQRYAGSHDAVSGIVRGLDDPQDEVWCIAHSAEPGAADNASGVSACVEAARTLETLIASKQLQRPRRSIRFLNAYECYGFFHYLEHTERLQTPLAGINLDMVGLKPELCQGRMSWHESIPASAQFVNEVGRTIFHSVLQEPKPLYQLKREPFRSTDDTLVGDPKYGFPCPWLTHCWQADNRMYEGYHSSHDTCERLSARGLALSAAGTAGYLYFLANAGSQELMELASADTRHLLDVMQHSRRREMRGQVEYWREQHSQSLNRLQRWMWGGDRRTTLEHLKACARDVDHAAQAIKAGQHHVERVQASRSRRFPRNRPLLNRAYRAIHTIRTHPASAMTFLSRSRLRSAARRILGTKYVAAGISDLPLMLADLCRHPASIVRALRPASIVSRMKRRLNQDKRIPRRTAPFVPDLCNVVPNLRRQLVLLEEHVRRWALFWADGNRSIAEIAQLLECEYETRVDVGAVNAYFEIQAALGYVRLVEPDRLVTKAQLIADLIALGVRPGMDLIVHSSLRRIGHAQGGAGTVVDALLAVIGPEGTLMMPSFNHRRAIVYNPMTTPTTSGAIPEAMWRRPDAVRSLHGTHAVTAIGPKAAEWCENHSQTGVATPNSPLGKITHTGGFILRIGTNNMTAVHVAETAVPCRCIDEFGNECSIVMPDGRIKTERCTAFRTEECPERKPLERRLRQSGLQRYGNVGNAEATLVKAIDMWTLHATQLQSICPSCPIKPSYAS